jgi:hypothetical protein
VAAAVAVAEVEVGLEEEEEEEAVPMLLGRVKPAERAVPAVLEAGVGMAVRVVMAAPADSVEEQLKSSLTVTSRRQVVLMRSGRRGSPAIPAHQRTIPHVPMEAPVVQDSPMGRVGAEETAAKEAMAEPAVTEGPAAGGGAVPAARSG